MGNLIKLFIFILSIVFINQIFYLFKMLFQIPKLFYFTYRDYINKCKEKEKKFEEFGLRLYCGPQGSGKTTAMVRYLEHIRHKYPRCLIVSNFGYKHQHHAFEDWEDIFKYSNGEYGIVFAVDEIHSEFSSNDWNLFPEDLLRQVTQQRKQRIQIVGSSQRFNRVVVQLREQAFQVVECRTLFRRWTFEKCYSADEYVCVLDNPEKKMKLHKLWKNCFVQTDEFRSLFDTYEKIERMKNRYKMVKGMGR